MGALFSINNAKQDDLDKHGAAIPILFQILNAQSQPIHITRATETGIELNLRVNLQEMQARRLIINPLIAALPAYAIEVDFKTRTLTMERKAVANQKPARKPAKRGRPVKDRGVSDLQQDEPVVVTTV